ncbi:MAG TPA: SAF domain-containing protein, partial [Erythrobacter sp.]|nr:SAF domain-containing protein [Erythrobacter sp.]
VLQRRCLRAAGDLSAGTQLTREMIDVLRPAPAGAIMPYDLEKLLGKRLLVDLKSGQEFTWDLVGA